MKRILKQSKKKFKLISRGNRSVFYLLGIIIAAMVVMSFLDPNFFTVRNLFNVLNQQATLGIATMGVAIAMITGCIDLTIGNLLASTAAIAAILLNAGVSNIWVILLTCLAGLVAGVLNGVIVVKTRIDTFIASLGLMSVYQGVALIIPNGNNIYLQGKFVDFGTYRIAGIIPLPVIYFIVITIIVYMVMRFTKFGRRLY